MQSTSGSAEEIDPHELDLGHLALFAGYAFADAVQKELESRHSRVRFGWGFVFQHLLTGDKSVNELAERMGITQQAVSKTVKELVSEGLVAVDADPDDARVRRVALSKEGRALIEASRRARRRLVDKLEKKIGAKEMERARVVLVEVLDALGGAAAVRHRRVPERR